MRILKIYLWTPSATTEKERRSLLTVIMETMGTMTMENIMMSMETMKIMMNIIQPKRTQSGRAPTPERSWKNQREEVDKHPDLIEGRLTKLRSHPVRRVKVLRQTRLPNLRGLLG